MINKNLNNIKIIGTTHLMSKEEIVKIIEEEKPEIICVELCKTRFDILCGDNKQEEPVPEQQEIKGSIMDKIVRVVRDKSKQNNQTYGSDMISASEYALEHKIPLALIDRDFMELRTLMSLIPVKEQEQFQKDIIQFDSLSKEESKKESENLDEDKFLNELKTNYPVSYEFLIESRDNIIIKNILKVALKNPGKKILVFVGKGHLKRINGELN